jgi:hypothetical protein
MNRDTHSLLHSPHLHTGVLTDHELLLGGILAGKPVLQARLLPREASEVGGLLEYLWEQEVTTVWVLPTARLSQEITSELLLQMNGRWTELCAVLSQRATPGCGASGDPGLPRPRRLGLEAS